MQSCTISGIITQYERIGKGPVLVLLHGWANTWNAWYTVIPKLSTSHTLIIPDLPGFGASETPKETSWDSKQYADWLSVFLKKAVGTKPFAVAGHSFGGQVAVAYATMQKQPKPQQLILIASAGLKKDKSLKNVLVGEFVKLFPNSLKRRAPKFIKHMVYEKILVETDYFRGDPFQKSVLKSILSEDFMDDLSKINIPTLIINGAHDPAIPLKHGQIMKEHIPNSTIVVCESSEHFPHITETPKVLQAIERFLS